MLQEEESIGRKNEKNNVAIVAIEISLFIDAFVYIGKRGQPYFNCPYL